MSESNTPFNDSAIDPFLSSIDDYTQDQLDALFACFTSDEPAFPFTTAKNPLDSDFDFTFPSPFSSSHPSLLSTPDFSSYAVSRPTTFSYPLPSTGGSPPQAYFQSPLHPSSSSRPLPIHTNSSFLLPHHPPSNSTRRRSLSTNDLPHSHPTFIRLQSARSRSRSTTPEKERRAPYQKHSRSRSQGPGAVKNAVQLGTPLSEPRRMRARMLGRGQASEPPPVMRGMGEGQMDVSRRRIIEIGAMGVRDAGTLVVDPGLETEHARMVKILGEIERYLQGDEDARRGVELIRGALAKVGLGEEEDGDVEHTSLDAPLSLGLGGGEEDLFGGGFLEDGEFARLLSEQE